MSGGFISVLLSKAGYKGLKQALSLSMFDMGFEYCVLCVFFVLKLKYWGKKPKTKQ